MQDARKAVWSIQYVSVAFFPRLKHNFIAYPSSKVSSRPDCIFETHQLWQSGFSRVYSNCCCSCSFKAEIIKIGQSSHKMYSNNIVNFQESMTISNAYKKRSGNLLNEPRNCKHLWSIFNITVNVCSNFDFLNPEMSFWLFISIYFNLFSPIYLSIYLSASVFHIYQSISGYFFSLFLPIYLSIYLSVLYFYIYLSVLSLSIYLSIYLSICSSFSYLSIYFRLFLSLSLPLCLSVCLSLPIYLFQQISIYLSILLAS